jgi:FtsX-like permease family
MSSKRGGERVLESRHLIALFLGVVLLCCVFFTLGYVMGKTQYGNTPVQAASLESAPRSLPARDAKAPAQPAVSPEWDFYTAKKTTDVPLNSKRSGSSTSSATRPSVVPSVPADDSTPAAANSQPTTHVVPQPARASYAPPPARFRAPRMSRNAVVLQVAALRHESDALALADVLQQKGFPVAPAGSKFPLTTIVGVAADVKRLSLREGPPPEMYVAYTQKVWPSLLTMDVVLRTAQDSASVAASARNTIRAIDSDLPLANVKPLAEIVSDSMTQPRFVMLLIAAFGALALLLAMIGMYGVISYSVAQRTQEIGIRVALGAQRRTIFQMILGQGARLAAFGIAIGLLAASGVTRVMGSFLYGVTATDPLTFAIVSVLLLGLTLLACYVPARRAMKVDPMVALRYE